MVISELLMSLSQRKCQENQKYISVILRKDLEEKAYKDFDGSSE